MINKNNIKMIFKIGLISLFIFSAVTPMVIGYKVSTTNEDLIDEHYIYDRFDRYYFPEQCSPEIRIPGVQSDDVRLETLTYPIETSESFQIETQKEEPSFPVGSTNAPMDSPWPMYCHDVRHTGRSPYSTAGNPGIEKWRFPTDWWVNSDPVIDNEGVIYFGSTNDFYAMYPNGTVKWKKEIGAIMGASAIDGDDVIYVGTAYASPNYLYAIYTSNGTLKWKYRTGNHVHGSPAIGEDGTIYFGRDGSGSPPYSGYILALYPNGTLKWEYKTDHFIYSSPAIGDDGTVYCGSHDGNMYALYPNNGSLKWKYQTSDWVARGASIVDDGTVYFGSWDGYLYAVYPNGTLNWKTGGYLAGTTPVVAQDGTIYVGNRYLTAVNPDDGSVKWTFDPGPDRTIRGSNPCISADGTIFLGTHIGEYDGGELIAVNSDGSEHWRIMLATDHIWSAPAIGEDGTVYVGSINDLYHPGSEGYLHAIGPLDPDAPSAPTINGQTSGNVGTEYEYTFKSTSPLGRDVYYYLDWGDGTISDWFGPFESGEIVTVTHKWPTFDRFTIKARAKDADNLWGPWGEFEVSMPRNKVSYNPYFLRFLEQFPNAFPILRYLLGL